MTVQHSAPEAAAEITRGRKRLRSSEAPITVTLRTSHSASLRGRRRHRPTSVAPPSARTPRDTSRNARLKRVFARAAGVTVPAIDRRRKHSRSRSRSRSALARTMTVNTRGEQTHSGDDLNGWALLTNGRSRSRDHEGLPQPPTSPGQAARSPLCFEVMREGGDEKDPNDDRGGSVR
jgi:hypothetical protein